MSTGEGSRGGKVIRHTKGGYAVYDSSGHESTGMKVAKVAGLAAVAIGAAVVAKKLHAARVVLKSEPQSLKFAGRVHAWDRITAYQGGKHLGMVEFQTLKPIEEIGMPGKLNVNSIFVEAAHRGKGVGTKLMTGVIKQAQKSGAKTVEGSLISPEAVHLRSKFDTTFISHGAKIAKSDALMIMEKIHKPRVDAISKVPLTVMQHLKESSHGGLAEAKHFALGSAEALIPSAIGSDLVSVLYGKVAHASADPKVFRDLKSAPIVDSKSTIKGMKEFKNVEVITSRKELMASKTMSDDEKEDFSDDIDQFTGGKNAAAWKSPDSGHEYVFSSKKINKQVIGHELGHIRDFRSGKLAGSSGSFSQVLSGHQVAIEESAWDNSPFKGPQDHPTKEDALDTYKINRASARIFVGGTAALTAGYAIAKRKAMR